MHLPLKSTIAALALLALAAAPALGQNIAVRAKTIHTMAGEAIEDGVIVIRDGKIAAVGPAARTQIPEGFKTIEAEVVTPGLIDARATIGLTGIYNQPQDQDQLDRSGAIQPELRAIDAYNPQDRLIEYVRSFGITTVHTGHAPGALISGQMCIVKLRGNTVDEAVVNEETMIAATLGDAGRRAGGGSPGTRGKAVAMLRAELIKAQEYQQHQSRQQRQGDDGEARENGQDDDRRRSQRGRDLRMEALVRVLEKEVPLLITADRAQDIASALRIAEEFDIDIVLDSASESYLLIDRISEAGVPVILHPPMQRATGEKENASFETAAKLREAGIPVAMQSSFEGYVPKVRLVLFEAAIVAANGLSFEQALATITRDAAEILGIADRLGTIEEGKDGDLALFNGDPFEFTSRCTGTIIEGELVSDKPR